MPKAGSASAATPLPTEWKTALAFVAGPPPGRDRLILGHESLGRAEQAPAGGSLAPGALVVGIVPRPDPVPCLACAAGEWDMCRNGLYTERGIKERDGYCAERFRSEPDYLITIDPAVGTLGVLLEPTSVVAKAWEHIECIGSRALWRPQTVLVTGAGPIGLLAALLGMGSRCMCWTRSPTGPSPPSSVTSVRSTTLALPRT